jgi:O-succinylbenzoic acid--CoA ligase
VGGLTVITKALHQGTTLTVHPRFDPDAVNASPATLVSLVGTVLDRVDTARFRRIVIGGDAPPSSLPANVVSTYGMTETGSGVVYDGIPLDGVEVTLDERQEILIKSATLLRAYRDGSDPKRDGWLPTGDVGSWDPDGRLIVHGRDDMIVSGGENVYAGAVEAALARHESVAEIGVAGVPDEQWGHVVVAFVVPHGAPPSLESLRDLAKQTLPAYAAPRRLMIVDSLPRTSLGKIRRAELAGYIAPDRTPAPPSIT